MAVDVTHGRAYRGAAPTRGTEVDPPAEVGEPEKLSKVATRTFIVATLSFQVAWLAVLAAGAYLADVRVVELL